jgi:hypothetical protein
VFLAALAAGVARVVFSSPGALAPALDDGSGGGVRGRLPTARQLRLYALLVRPRALLGYGLLQVSPRAAHAFAGDAEMDARNDRVYNAGRAGAHCRGAGPGPALRLPVLVLGPGLPPGPARCPARLPAPGRPQRLPGPAGRVPGHRAGLPGRPLPTSPWAGDGAPADYQGLP